MRPSAFALPRRSLQLLRHVLFGVLTCLGFALSATAQPATGVISGRVLNPASGEYIRNVEVKVEGTSLVAVTESDGFYRISNAPLGEVTLVASYTGHDTVSAKVNVGAGTPVTRDFELVASGTKKPGSDTVVLSAFVVETEREGNAKAISEQRNAMNVKTVVATDTFGDIAEGNVGEFLKFMPGITLDYVETDTRAARMGGLEARYGAVTLDGSSMANTSTGTFGADSRQFEFEAVSINNIETIEVNKTLSADMPGDSPGGSINMRSKSPLDRNRSSFNYTVGVIGNQYEHSVRRTPRHDDAEHAKTRPTLTFDYGSGPLFGKKFGFQVNGAFSNVFKEQFRHALTYDYTSTQAIAAGTPLITAINFKDGPKIGEKSSGGTKLEFAPFPGLRLALTGSYTLFSDEIANRNLNFRVSSAQLGAGSSLTRVVALPSGANANTRIEQTGSHGKKKTDTTDVSLGFVYRWRSFEFDGKTSYSRARQQNGSDHMGTFGTSDLQLTRIGFIAERPSADSPSWSFVQTSGADWSDFNNYGRNDAQTGNISGSRSRSKTQQFVQTLNAKYTTGWGKVPTYFKGGFYSRLSVRDREQLKAYTGTWVGPTGSGLTSRMPVSSASFLISPAWGGNLYSLPVPDKGALYSLAREHPEYFTATVAQQATSLDTILGSNQDVEEQIYAGYLMSNSRVGRWQFQTGLRYEKTNTENKVIERVPDSKNPYAANTLERIRYRYSLPRSTREGEFDAWLPSGSATYSFARNLKFKAGYNRSVSRPPLNQLAGQWAIDETNLEIQIPNPDLKPSYADKYSAGFEWYFEPAGTASVHFFEVDQKGDTDETSPAPASEFGYGDDPVYSAYEFTTFVNIPGRRTTKGVELNYSQQLTFFRSEWLRGTRVFATYSRFAQSRRGNNFVPQNASGGLSWKYRKVNASIAGTWTDEVFTGSNTVAATSRYTPGDREVLQERFIFDVGLGYRFNRNTSFFLSGRNAFNSGKTWYFKSNGRIRQMERYGGQWTVGIRGNY
jgi:iron complex outermembrane receptor protein